MLSFTFWIPLDLKNNPEFKSELDFLNCNWWSKKANNKNCYTDQFTDLAIHLSEDVRLDTVSLFQLKSW